MHRGVVIGVILSGSCMCLIFYWNNGFNPHLIHSKRDEIHALASTLLTYKDSVTGLRYNDQPNPPQPEYFELGDLLTVWQPDDVNPEKWIASSAHPNKGKGIARFDFQNKTQRVDAQIYCRRELPFIMYNIPELNTAADTYFTHTKLEENVEGKVNTEKSSSNKFIYYSLRKSTGRNSPDDPSWTAPQTVESMHLSEFFDKVHQAEKSHNFPSDGRRQQHHYLMLSYSPQQSASTNLWIKEALPFFAPPRLRSDTEPLFYNSELYRGIVCRFGSKGITAAAHFDGQRNFVAMVRGRKRYILLPPSECSRLSLYQVTHPSARHSSIDWSNATQVHYNKRLFEAQATEVVVSMGEILYIPANWFHYIVSQDASIQCSSRSGATTSGDEEIAKCGFRRKKPVK